MFAKILMLLAAIGFVSACDMTNGPFATSSDEMSQAADDATDVPDDAAPGLQEQDQDQDQDRIHSPNY